MHEGHFFSYFSIRKVYDITGVIQGIRRTHGQPTREPRRTVSGYINICGAPSGKTTENPFGDHTNNVFFFFFSSFFEKVHLDIHQKYVFGQTVACKKKKKKTTFPPPQFLSILHATLQSCTLHETSVSLFLTSFIPFSHYTQGVQSRLHNERSGI